MTRLPDAQPLIRATAMPADTNPYGGMFGGWIMSQMALGAGALASRHSRGRAIVVAASDFRFPTGVVVGEELSVYASLVAQGRTSMTIDVEAWRRERDGDDASLAAAGKFTFVAVDAANQPRAFQEKSEAV